MVVFFCGAAHPKSHPPSCAPWARAAAFGTSPSGGDTAGSQAGAGPAPPGPSGIFAGLDAYSTGRSSHGQPGKTAGNGV